MLPMLSRRQLGLISSLLLLNALALFPLLTTGYSGDDLLNSQIRGEMIRTHLGLWGVTQYFIVKWITLHGRFFPLAFYPYAVFYVIRSVVLFKLFVLTVILAGLSAFYFFLRRLTGSELVPSTCLLLLPLVVQFCLGWDPILGFCAHYPLLTLLLFSSLFLFLQYLDDDDRRALAVATVLFLCCGLIFEISYLMCLLYFAVAYSRLRKHQAALLASLPFFAVTAVLATISLVLKKFAALPLQEYQPNLDPVQVIKAYTGQSFGALPFSYYWLNPNGFFSSQVARWPGSIVQGMPLLVALALTAVLWARRGLSSHTDLGHKVRTVDLIWLGGLLFALPQALIALSPKYQAMLWGTAYLPVYISRLGLTLLLAVLVVSIYQRTRAVWEMWPALSGFVLLVWLLIFAVNLHHNWLVANAETELWYPRALTEQAVRRGLLANVQPGSILLVSGVNGWDNANEYIGTSRNVYSVYQQDSDLTTAFRASGASCQATADRQDCTFGPDSPIYTLQLRHLANGTGAVLLAHVIAYQTNDRVRRLLADQVTAYFRLPASNPEPRGSISGRFIRPKSANASLFRVGDDRLDVLRRGRGWKLLSFRSGEPFDALSLRGDISPAVSDSLLPMVKSESAWELRPAGPPLLHVGYEGGTMGEGFQLPPIAFSDEMSIDLLVTPDESQVPWADILSNHHGSDFRGIAIEQRGDHSNEFALSLGNGTAWMNAGEFSLTPGRLNYVSLQVKDNQTMLYVDGRLVAKRIHPAPVLSTSRPLYVGNWIGGGRSFNGLVDEVLISSGNKGGDEIAADAARLLGKEASH